MPCQGHPAIDDKMLERDVQLTAGGPDPEKEEKVLLSRHRVSRIYYLKKFFDYPVSMKPQTFINMGFVRTVKAGVGYMYSAVAKRKENNLEDFMINRFGRPLYNMFFKNYTAKVWGREPKDISAAWGAQRIKGLSLSKTIADGLKKLFGIKNRGKVETSLIESFYYPKRGPGQLWESMRDEIINMGGEIIMNAEVSHFSCKESSKNITSLTYIKEGSKYEVKGDYFISTMPISELVKALNDVVKDKEVKQIAENLPYRDFMTIGLLVNKLKIKNKTKIKTMSDIVPDTWIYVQEDNIKMGRIQIFNNWSPYMVKDPQNTVWIGLEYFCNEGDQMWNMSDDSFKSMGIAELVSMCIIDVNDVIDSTCIRVKKAYPAYFGTYDNFDKVKKELNTFNNLYCIGRNGQHRYNNMDHSMLTAMEAVNVIMGKKDKDKIWDVNAEEEYHEDNKNK
ncbi:MAG: NAD(P)/FAD-dependent oxidoreductase, partial [Eubacterium sp.]